MAGCCLRRDNGDEGQHDRERHDPCATHVNANVRGRATLRCTVTRVHALIAPATRIAERLVARGETIAVAESSTGGLISAALLSVAGASAYYRGGVVIYTRESVKATLAGAVDLDPGTKGACEPFARYLAASAAARFATDWAVGETGATGPQPNPYGDPAGHSWIAVAGPAGRLEAEHVLTGSDDRVANMEAFAARALDLLERRLG